MKRIFDAVLERTDTPVSYDSVTRGGDWDCEIVDRAAVLAKSINTDQKKLDKLKALLRSLSDEIGEGDLSGNEYNALVTPAKKPTTYLNRDQVDKVLTKLHNDGKLSRYMLKSCYESKTPAHKVTFAKK
tara:strand:- start:557 stop:943 length:387 start_codon:yes stop_codon:yes gene_type:complete